MDIVFIKELCVETIIGIYDWERKIKQVVCIDLELETEISLHHHLMIFRTQLIIRALQKE